MYLIYVSWGREDNLISEKYMIGTYNKLKEKNKNVVVEYEDGLGHTIGEE